MEHPSRAEFEVVGAVRAERANIARKGDANARACPLKSPAFSMQG
jgi:hypothetical protein